MNKYLIASISLSSVMLLASCGGSSPAPWSRPDDSPWKEKHAAETQPAPMEETVYVPEPITEPVAEPAPMSATASRFETEPDPMSSRPGAMEPVAADTGDMAMPAPEGIEAERVVTAAPEDMVMNMPADSYAVQVYAAKGPESIAKFQENNGLEELKMVKTDRDGEIIYVLVGLYDDRASAREAAAELEPKIGGKPWVRSMAGLQKIVAQE